MSQKAKKQKKKSVGLNDLRWALRFSFQYVKRYRWYVVAYLILSVCVAAAQLGIPYAYARIIDELTRLSSPDSAQAMSSAFVYLGWLAGANVLIEGSYLFRGYIGGYLSARMRIQFQLDVAKHLLSLPVYFHKSRKTGELETMVTQASGSVFNIFMVSTRNFFTDIIVLPTALIVAFQTSALLFGVMLTGTIANVAIVITTNRKKSALRRETVTGQRVIGAFKHDLSQNILTIKQSAVESYFFKRFARLADDKYLKKDDSYRMFSRVTSALEGLSYIFAEIIVIGVSVYLISRGELTIGLLTMFTAYSNKVFSILRSWIDLWDPVQEDIIRLQDVDKEILAVPSEQQSLGGTIKVDASGDIIFENISFSHDIKTSVLKHISFSIRGGETVAIVGESGVGKSTLVDLIGRFLVAQKGSLTIAGQEISDVDPYYLRSQMAIVSQEITLFHASIEENIRVARPGSSAAQIQQVARLANVDQFVQRFPKKYKTMVGERGLKLSGGQKQRIAIARAMLRDPKILILDEPTSALDAKTEAEVTKALEQLMKGRTTIIIAHRLATVRKADKIIVLDKGKIAEIGKHDELIKKKNGVYKKLYDLQKI